VEGIMPVIAMTREMGSAGREAIGQKCWHLIRHAAVFEMPREDGEAHQQQE
jgi:hypothetical protein